MKQLIVILISLLFTISCSREKKVKKVHPVNWKERTIQLAEPDSLLTGSSYLSVYSEIYSSTQERTYDLTATISIRNMSSKDSIYITRADYFNTHGDLIRTYIKTPVFVKPLETIEIVVDQKDRSGGTGANFVFDWAVSNDNSVPLFEAVMISTSGQQGISFTTKGVRRN